MKKKTFVLPAVAPADPSQWSEKSQGAVAATFRTWYTDITYRCRHCGKDAVFTAREQKFAYETRKTGINVQRVLCEPCWRESALVAKKIAVCEQQWAASKILLSGDADFLSAWRELLLSHARYGARVNVATLNMLQKLIGRLTANPAGEAGPERQSRI